MQKLITNMGHHLSKEQDQNGKWIPAVNFAIAFDDQSFVEFSCPASSLLGVIQKFQLAQLELNGMQDKEKEMVRGAVVRAFVKNNMSYTDEQLVDIVERIVS